MAETNIQDIGEVQCEPVAASVAIGLYADLMRVVGKASHRLPAIIVGGASQDAHQNFAAEMQSIQGIVEVLAGTTSDEVVRIVKRLVELARIRQPSGTMRDLDLDGDFTGKLAALYPTLRFVLEVQFADFFTASLGSGIREVLREASRRPG